VPCLLNGIKVAAFVSHSVKIRVIFGDEKLINKSKPT